MILHRRTGKSPASSPIVLAASCVMTLLFLSLSAFSAAQAADMCKTPDGFFMVAVQQPGKPDEKGKLYAAISAKDVLEALKERGFPQPKNLTEGMITFDEPTKTIGSNEIHINFSVNEKILVKMEVEKLQTTETL